jgi:hypothetical protein
MSQQNPSFGTPPYQTPIVEGDSGQFGVPFQNRGSKAQTNLHQGWMQWFAGLYARLIQAVLGFANLTHVNRVTKVTAAGTIGESSITDDGTYVTTSEKVGRGGVSAPTTSLDSAASICSRGLDGTFPPVKFARMSLAAGAVAGGYYADFLGYDGGAAALIPTAIRGSVVIVAGNLGPGGNTGPAWPVDSIGDINTSGAFRASGTAGVGGALVLNLTSTTIQYKDWSGTNQSATVLTNVTLTANLFSGGIRIT